MISIWKDNLQYKSIDWFLYDAILLKRISNNFAYEKQTLRVTTEASSQHAASLQIVPLKYWLNYLNKSEESSIKHISFQSLKILILLKSFQKTMEKHLWRKSFLVKLQLYKLRLQWKMNYFTCIFFMDSGKFWHP